MAVLISSATLAHPLFSNYNPTVPFRVIIDTNFLAGSINLRTQRFAGLQSLVETAGGTLYLPQGVRTELIERHRKRLNETAQKRDALEKSFKEAAIESALPAVDIAAGVSTFEARLDKFIADEKIKLLPFPALPSTAATFEIAAKKELPFDENGESFRDAVIAFSVKEFAASTTDPVFFITEDAGFRTRLAKWLAATQVSAVTLSEAQDLIEKFLDSVDRLIRGNLSNAIDALVKLIDLKEFNELARKSATFTYSPPAGDTLISIDEFNADKVHGIDNLSIEKGSAAYVVHVHGHLTVTVKTMPNRAQMFADSLGRRLRRPRKVGDIAPPESEMSALAQYYGVQPVHEKWTVPVRVSFNCQSTLDDKIAPKDCRIVEVASTAERSGEILEERLTKLRQGA